MATQYRKIQGKLPEEHPLRKHPWEDVQRDYVEGYNVAEEGEPVEIHYPTQGDLADKYKISEQVIRNRAAKYRWTEHRNVFQQKMALERQRKMAEQMARKAVVFNKKSHKVAEDAIDIIDQRISYLKSIVGSEFDDSRVEMLEAKLRSGQPIDRSDTYGLVHFKEMEALANAMAKWQDVGHKALGIKDVDNNPAVAIQINQNNVGQTVREELARPDRTRIAGIMEVLGRSGTTIPGINAPTPEEYKALEASGELEAVEAEVVEDE